MGDERWLAGRCRGDGGGPLGAVGVGVMGGLLDLAGGLAGGLSEEVTVGLSVGWISWAKSFVLQIGLQRR